MKDAEHGEGGEGPERYEVQGHIGRGSAGEVYKGFALFTQCHAHAFTSQWSKHSYSHNRIKLKEEMNRDL